MQKEAEFLELRDQIRAIVDIHRVDFPPAVRLEADPFDPVDEAELVKQRQKEFLTGIPVWKRNDRKAAKERGQEHGVVDAAAERERRAAEQAALQLEYDDAWQRLLANDPDTTIGVVEQAFADNQAPAAPVNVEGDILSLVMLSPDESESPTRKPAVTPTGKASVKNMTKTEAADTYITLVTGHLLATIKEALAVTPGISAVRGVVVRQMPEDIYGERHMEVLLAGTFRREDLSRVKWSDALAPQIVQQGASDLLMNLKGRTPVLQPIPLDEEPELKAFIAALEERLQA